MIAEEHTMRLLLFVRETENWDQLPLQKSSRKPQKMGRERKSLLPPSAFQRPSRVSVIQLAKQKQNLQKPSPSITKKNTEGYVENGEDNKEHPRFALKQR